MPILQSNHRADRRVSGLNEPKEKTEVFHLDGLIARAMRIVTQARDESGQTLVEYALIIALVSITAVAALTALSGGINGTFSSIIASF
jgi:Flp pilus assembly pilin Flp